jgi:hypothetical protein
MRTLWSRVEGLLDPAKPAMLTRYIDFPQAGAPIDQQTRAARGHQ